jgi:hypothetical protein
MRLDVSFYISPRGRHCLAAAALENHVEAWYTQSQRGSTCARGTQPTRPYGTQMLILHPPMGFFRFSSGVKPALPASPNCSRPCVHENGSRARFICSWNDIREAGGLLGKVRSFVPASQRVAFSGRAAASLSHPKLFFFCLAPYYFFVPRVAEFYEGSLVFLAFLLWEMSCIHIDAAYALETLTCFLGQV